MGGHILSQDIVNEYPLPRHMVYPGGFALVVPLGQNATVILHAPIHITPSTYIVRVYDVDGSYEAYGIKFQTYVTVNQ